MRRLGLCVCVLACGCVPLASVECFDREQKFLSFWLNDGIRNHRCSDGKWSSFSRNVNVDVGARHYARVKTVNVKHLTLIGRTDPGRMVEWQTDKKCEIVVSDQDGLWKVGW